MPRSAVHPDLHPTLLSVTALPGHAPAQVVVEVIGEVDAATAPLLQLCLDGQADQDAVQELVVDLRRVSFLGAAGVAVLARTRQRCEARGARLVVRTGGRRSVLRAIQLTGMAQRLGVELPGDTGRGSAPRAPRRAPGLPGRCAAARQGSGTDLR